MIIIISVLSIAIIIFSVLYFQKSNTSIEKSVLSNPLCSDSDNGKNIYIKGSATTRAANDLKNAGEIIHMGTDTCAEKLEDPSSGAEFLEGLNSCSGNNCYIKETFCGEHPDFPRIGLIDQGEFIQCPNGCNDGACTSAFIIKGTLRFHSTPFQKNFFYPQRYTQLKNGKFY